MDQLEPQEGFKCSKWEAPVGHEQDVFIQALQYLAENANLVDQKQCWSLPDFKAEVVDREAPLPVFCNLCGQDFFTDSSDDKNEKLEKLHSAMPENSRVVSFSCGNHHAHLACMLFTPANIWSKIARDDANNIHARAIHIPNKECVFIKQSGSCSRREDSYI